MVAIWDADMQQISSAFEVKIEDHGPRAVVAELFPCDFTRFLSDCAQRGGPWGSSEPEVAEALAIWRGCLDEVQ